MKIIILILCLFISLLNFANAGEMYKCIDRDGNTIFTDMPQDGMKCDSKEDEIETTNIKHAISDGIYLLEVEMIFSDRTEKKTEQLTITVTNENGIIKLVNQEQPKYPILGRMEQNVFRAHIGDAGGRLDFVGKIQSLNTIKGTIKGNDGKSNITGSFSIQAMSNIIKSASNYYSNCTLGCNKANKCDSAMSDRDLKACLDYCSLIQEMIDKKSPSLGKKDFIRLFKGMECCARAKSCEDFKMCQKQYN